MPTCIFSSLKLINKICKIAFKWILIFFIKLWLYKMADVVMIHCVCRELKVKVFCVVLNYLTLIAIPMNWQSSILICNFSVLWWGWCIPQVDNLKHEHDKLEKRSSKQSIQVEKEKDQVLYFLDSVKAWLLYY